jgi:hypothetical protein
MTNYNTPQLSRMDLPIHCAAFPGLSLLTTRSVTPCIPVKVNRLRLQVSIVSQARNQHKAGEKGVELVVLKRRMTDRQNSVIYLFHLIGSKKEEMTRAWGT